MRQLDADLWVAESPLRFFGLEVGARMTTIRLPDGSLLLHSPIAFSPELANALEPIGPVAHLVGPNLLHHLFLDDWQDAFPNAATWLAPGLERKRADLKVTGVLSDEPEPAWKDVVDQVEVEGFPFANEIVFFHRPSATLIMTDLAFNICDSSPPATRFALRIIGREGALAPTLLERMLIRDRDAFRGSLRRILDWPFERAIVAHGEVCEGEARDQLMRGYDWLLRT